MEMPLQQHPSFAAALRLLGRNVQQLDVDGAQPIVAVRLFGQMMASRGPLWHGPANAVSLRQSNLRLLNAETDEASHLQAAGFRKLATAATVAELDLGGSDAARLAATSGKWRNRWRRAQEAPVTIELQVFSPAKHNWLLKADHLQQKQKRFRGMPHALTTAFAAPAPDQVMVHIAYFGDDPVAAMLFLSHHPVVTYHIGWISEAGRQWGLHHRLLLDAATLYAGQGLTRLDLGTVDTENAPGLARFKINSGAQIRPLGGTWLRMERASR
jgi:hypothetical protein